MFQKKGVLQRYWLKYTDRQAYHQYKWALSNENKIRFSKNVINSPALTSRTQIINLASKQQQLNLSHSGNAGDVIYALATIKQVHEISGAKINIYLTAGQPLKYRGDTPHPLGNVMLNEKMIEMLVPLIGQQDYISTCQIYADQEIDLDLDHFRNGLIPLDKGNIARWYGYICGINAELSKPWLEVRPNEKYSRSIVLARSERYRGRKIDYSFLKNFKDLIFIGVESEYNDMKKYLPDIRWVRVNDFLEMAQIIKGCRFFIGNQSFPFSMAEALKVPRILETSFEVINVVPEGENAFDFLFQEHFESLVQLFDSKTSLSNDRIF